MSTQSGTFESDPGERWAHLAPRHAANNLTLGALAALPPSACGDQTRTDVGWRICDRCWPRAEVLGDVIEGLALVTDADDFVLIGGAGHTDDDVLRFVDAPVPEAPEDEAWAGRVETEMASLRVDALQRSKRLTQRLIESGYRPEDGHDLELWLYARAALLAGADLPKES